MDNRLLKKLRKEAFEYVKIHPNGFEATLEKKFGEEAPVHVVPGNMGFDLFKKFSNDNNDSSKSIEIEGVTFIPDFLMGQYFSLDIPLREARRILPTLRRLYVKFQAERLRKKANERKYAKDYKNFVKKLEEI
jgi:hypothetical protein